MRIQHRPDCHRCPMKQDSKTRQLGPQASVPDPRRHLLSAVLAFVRAARSSPGVLRIALLGSLSTNKPVPRDADVLVTIDAAMDLSSLARFGRRLKGTAQTINLGADIFLADRSEHYLGRICHYRECHPRVACRALQCGQRQHLNDDLQIVTLSPTLISAPPIDLWPRIVRRSAVPPDTEALLAELENDETLRYRNHAAAHDANDGAQGSDEAPLFTWLARVC